MANRLLVVEGAHDAAFFGRLLRRRGFAELRTLGELSEVWRGLVPSQYPIRSDGRLDRIVAYPNVFKRAELVEWVGIAVAGGENNMLETLRIPVEKNSISTFSSIGLVYDADWKISLAERSRRIFQRLDDWSKEETAAGLEGFPIEFPTKIGDWSTNETRFGVHVFPGAGQLGMLETLLIECAEISLPTLQKECEAFISSVLANVAPEHIDKIQDPSGLDKCRAAVVASVLNPGASLAVSIAKSNWIDEATFTLNKMKEADSFLENLLKN